MKIEITASWEGSAPQEFMKPYTQSDGTVTHYADSPIIRLEYGLLTIGSYKISIGHDDMARKLKRALEALYPS